MTGKSRMTFAEFMQFALYDPRNGYYVKDKARIGKGGDFVTGPTTSPLFGEILADAIVDLHEGTIPSAIIEFGGATGYLAHDILKQLQWHIPYTIVEKNHIQQTTSDRRIKYVPSLAGVPKKACRNPVVIANEFLDALPFHWLVQTKEGLQEIYVKKLDDTFQEEIGPLSNNSLNKYFEQLGENPRVGNRMEVSLDSLKWLRSVQKYCPSPTIILIDYGRSAHELCEVTRPRGTVRCFDKHHLDDNPYVRVGAKDITADVNWTAVEKEAKKIGFEQLEFMSQGKFLLKHGEKLLHERAFTEKEGQGLKTLIHPEWMGGAFQVMVLRKG